MIDVFSFKVDLNVIKERYESRRCQMKRCQIPDFKILNLVSGIWYLLI
jgi:hypothetical protein